MGDRDEALAVRSRASRLRAAACPDHSTLKTQANHSPGHRARVAEDALLKTVVVPLDGSQFAERALPYAQILARSAGAHVVLVRAVKGGSSRSAPETADADEQRARGELALVSDRLEQEGIATTTLTPFDEASWAIITAVQEESADLIVMSTHGRAGLGRWVRHGPMEAWQSEYCA